MATKLDKTIRREIEIDGETFTVAISPEGLRLTKKRFRSGVAFSWKSMWGRFGRVEQDGNRHSGPNTAIV
jgi:hypothetical protein